MQDLLVWLAGWYNLPFLISLGISLGMVILELLTGGISELVNLDFDFDVDHDIDFDIEVDVNAHGIVGGLGWLGFGKAPISVLLEVLLGSFGATGLLVSALGNDLLGATGSWLALLIALPVAFFVSFFTTHFVGSVIHKYIPNTSSNVATVGSHVGQAGRAMGLVTASVGQVRVETPGDAPVLVNAVTADGDSIPGGAAVHLVSYDTERRKYIVASVQV